MKKALVMTFVLVLGLGVAAFAGPLSGSWSTTIGIDPDATDLAYFFTKLDSTLAVDYTIGAWTFGSSTGFDKTGFSAQSFSASGTLGAFTFSSAMSFSPAVISVKDYTAFWAGVTFPITQTPSTSICPISYTTTSSAPAFLKWSTTASVSIAGVDFEGYFLLDNSANPDTTLLKNYVTTLTGTQSDSCTAASTKYQGAGWRFKVSGVFDGVTITSYTYFGMTEKDASAVTGVYCPVVGKSGTFTMGDDCTPTFTEQYLLLEGFAFGCASIDIGLSILCTGFDDVTFVVSDILIGGWLDLDFGIIFGVSSKDVDLCLSFVSPAVECLTIEIGFGGIDNVLTEEPIVISDITINGVSLVYTWNGITFTSITELGVNSTLLSTASAWAYLNGADNSYLIPYAGLKGDCVTYFDTTEGFYELQCVAADRYKLWEKFVIDVDADSCCGGLLDITVSTWFGDHQVLDYVGYITYEAETAYDAGYDTTYVHLAGSATAAAAAIALLDAIEVDDYEDAEGVVLLTGYKAGTQTTLFAWAKTEVDLGFGVGSNITLTLGFDVSAFGWEALEFGFEFTF